MSEAISVRCETVPQTILHHLGGTLFCRTTGAKDFIHGDKSLTMSVPIRVTRNSVNRVRITSLAVGGYKLDTFHFMNKTGLLKKLTTAKGFQLEEVQSVFRCHTGLECAPPNVVLFVPKP